MSFNQNVLPGGDRRLRVFYGWHRSTPKFKKKELMILFENCYGYSNDDKIKRWMNLYHCRYQTKQEQSDADMYNRMFTLYRTFINDKPWNGDLAAVLQNNFLADENHVSLKERQKIREKLEDGYYKTYDIDPNKPVQLQILFE